MIVTCTQQIDNEPGIAILQFQLDAADLEKLSEGQILSFEGVQMGEYNGSFLMGTGDLTTYR
jgi:hypothetical protein